VLARQGETTPTSTVLFDGPVFDEQTTLELELSLREVDDYGRFGIDEAPFGDGDELATFVGAVPLEDGTFTVEGEDLTATVEVDLVAVY
jgi:hypothetical protein